MVDNNYRPLFPDKAQSSSLHLKLTTPADLPPFHEMVLLEMTKDPQWRLNDQDYGPGDYMLDALWSGSDSYSVNRRAANEKEYMKKEEATVGRSLLNLDHYLDTEAVSIPSKNDNLTRNLIFPQGDAFRVAKSNNPEEHQNGLRIYPKFGPMWGGKDNPDSKMMWSPQLGKLVPGEDADTTASLSDQVNTHTRSSNFAEPRTHIKSLLIISKQTQSERGDSAWFDDPQSFKVKQDVMRHHKDDNIFQAFGHWASELGQTEDWVEMKARRVIPNEITSEEKKYGLAKGQYQAHWDTPYGRSMYAMRLGFYLKPHPNTWSWLVEKGSQTASKQVRLLGNQPAYPGPRGYPGCDLSGSPIYQYALPPNLQRGKRQYMKDTDKFGEVEMEMCHNTTAASPYFWLGRDKWPEILEKDEIRFMPFHVPQNDMEYRTRPITYRFWDDEMSTSDHANHNPTFPCPVTQKSNWWDSDQMKKYLEDLPDMQHFRDAIQRFVVDDADIIRWSTNQDPKQGDIPFPMVKGESRADYTKRMLNVIDPKYYKVMPNSLTGHDVEFTPDLSEEEQIFDTGKDAGLTMTRRRRLYLEQMMLANPNAVKDWMHTWCPNPESVGTTQLFHWGKIDPSKNEFMHGSLIANADEVQRILNDQTMAGSAECFSTDMRIQAADMITMRHVSMFSQQFMAMHVASALKYVRAQATQTAILFMAKDTVLKVGKMGIDRFINSVGHHISRETTFQYIRAIGGTMEGDLTEKQMVDRMFQTVYTQGLQAVPANLAQAAWARLYVKYQEVAKSATQKVSDIGAAVGEKLNIDFNLSKYFKRQVTKDFSGSYSEKTLEKVRSYVQKKFPELVDNGLDLTQDQAESMAQNIAGSVGGFAPMNYDIPGSDLTLDTIDEVLDQKVISEMQKEAQQAQDLAVLKLQEAEANLEAMKNKRKLAALGFTEEQMQSEAFNEGTALMAAEMVDGCTEIIYNAVPIIACAALIAGFEAWEYYLDAEKRKLQREREQLREKVTQELSLYQYYNEPVQMNVHFLSEQQKAFMTNNLKADWTQPKTRNPLFYTDEKGNKYHAKSANAELHQWQIPYQELLRGIAENKYSLRQVMPGYITEKVDNAKGHNLRTAEMLRQMKLVDYYMRDSIMYPVGTDGEWGGVKRPFPPQKNEPATLIPSMMTPLPLLEYALQYSKMIGKDEKHEWMQNREKWYGPWAPRIIKKTKEKSTIPEVPEFEIPEQTWDCHPVPVFVGFHQSPTGFVSSESPMMAWPTEHNRQGGRMAPLRFSKLPHLWTPFKDKQNLDDFLNDPSVKTPSDDYDTVVTSTTPPVAITLAHNRKKVAGDVLYTIFNNSERHMTLLIFGRSKEQWPLVHSVPISSKAAIDVREDEDLTKYHKGNLFNLVLFETDALPDTAKNVHTEQPSRMWSDYYLSNAAGTTRSVYWEVKTDRPTTRAFPNAYLTADLMKRNFECGGITEMYKKFDRVQKKTQSNPRYKILNKLMTELKTHALDALACNFAGWMSKTVTITNAGGDAIEHFLVSPYTPKAQRALYFTMRYVLSKKATMLREGGYKYDEIYATLRSTDPSAYIMKNDQFLWDSMNDDVVSYGAHKPTPDEVPVGGESPGRDVGPELVQSDYNPMLIDRNWQSWLVDVLWNKCCYMIPLDDPDSGEYWMPFRTFADEFAGVTEHADTLWANLLPVLNNKQSGYKLAQTVNNEQLKNIYYDAEEVRQTRIRIAKNQLANLRTNLLLNEMDLRSAETLAQGEGRLVGKLTTPGDFAVCFLSALRSVLIARGLPHWHYSDHAGLQNLDNETQIFAQMCKESNERIDRRASIIDPATQAIYWYQPNHSLHNMATYFCTSSDGQATLKTPCVVITFRGTQPWKEIVEAYGSVTQPLLYSKDAKEVADKYWKVIDNPVGDLNTDRAIFWGEDWDSPRFRLAVSHAATLMTVGFKDVPHVYLAGHSLGGAIAMHVLQQLGRNPRIVKGTVFNPGVGCRPEYISMVIGGACGGESYLNKMWRFWFKNYSDFQKAQQNYYKTEETEGKPIFCTKLVTHKCGGPTSSWIDNDPVSVNSGGVGLKTVHYEGGNIPSGRHCHTSAMFNTDRIQTILGTGSHPHGYPVTFEQLVNP
jgi:hypothetical protein